MRIDRRLVLIGIMIIVLSMTMATQYASTQVGYSFAIVHPSNADIRFIGSDNSSDDGNRVLRVLNNNSGTQYLTIELGDWAPHQKKNYTAAFGIVNEEPFAVNITHVNVSGTNATYLDVWLHGDRDADYAGEVADSVVRVVNDGVAVYSSTNVAWTLAAGDGTTTTMDGAGVTTLWDTVSDVQYSVDDTDATNETDDYVWVGVSINLPSTAGAGTPTGTISIHFKSTTIS
jgi:hypothetical protein